MADGSRNLIVLSDGTGNSASKAFKTNVWRLYQAVSLTDGTQVAVFGDGVGTSSLKVMRVIGLALGIGVKRNVLNLYKFLCRNYNPGDRIWAFGFSRGAFTIRVLAGLIYREGLVPFTTEAELHRNALAAYRSYRRRAFPTKIPWVVAGQALRDWLIRAWNTITGVPSYGDVRRETERLKRASIDVHFLGVWDTVVAYGLPIDELTQAVDKWIWPMKFRDDRLLPNVQHARHALSLDDERRTFHPIPWNETKERALVADKTVAAGRLRQVWFAGMHADVGGGYPDDGLSYVALCWMIQEAAAQGLRLESSVVTTYHALAAPTGRMYDSRSGGGVLWRYQPRDVDLLMHGNTPLVHGSVITRMICGNDGYAPISLPERIEVVPGSGPPVAFATAAVQRAVADAEAAPEPPTPEARHALRERRRVLGETRQLVALGSAQPARTDIFKLVLDTVWWRRVVYFVSLFFALMAGAFPLVAKYLGVKGVTDHLNDRAGGPVAFTLGLIKGFLPGVAEPWLNAVIHYPVQAVLVGAGLVLSLALSTILQRRIADRARAAWNVRPRVGGMTLNPLAPTGQRHALAKLTAACFAMAIGAGYLAPQKRWLLVLFTAAGIVFGCWFALRRHRRATVDPGNPNRLLRLARTLRTSRAAVRAYRIGAQQVAPAFFLVLVGLLVVSLVHRGVFDLLSTSGRFCRGSESAIEGKRSDQELEAAARKEILGRGVDFRTDAKCHPTTRWLVAGGRYRIRLEINEDLGGEWFDKGVRTGVGGFAAESPHHWWAAPFKRWWRENWFQPIARIGVVGNYEHVLRPVAPLPDFRPTPETQCEEAAKARGRGDWNGKVSSPASDDFKRAQIACDDRRGARPPRVLVSDITADATGELFIYVNDAVLLWPGRTWMFYGNNSGTAKVTVTRILATTVESPAAEGKP